MPVGRLTFALEIAVATSSMPIPCAASWRGSTSILTAYFCEPPRPTDATPLTIEIRWAMVCAYSSTTDSGSVGEFRPSISTGWSAGLTFCRDGGAGICGGSCRAAFAIIACTSWAAASILRLRSNWRVMEVASGLLAELIEVTPAIVANCFSSGSATLDAIVSGLAPEGRR